MCNCPHCGKPISKTDKEATTVAEGVIMKKCLSCGAELYFFLFGSYKTLPMYEVRERILRCNKCHINTSGIPRSRDSDQRFCPICADLLTEKAPVAKVNGGWQSG